MILLPRPEPTLTPHSSTTSEDTAADSIASELFFIVGAPRSGTTLLQRMLSNHSKMFIGAETEFFMKFATLLDDAAFDDGQWERALGYWFGSKGWVDQAIDTEEFRGLLEGKGRGAKSAFLSMMEIHARRVGCYHIGEKSPHHCRHVRAILKMFPSAKFIHLIRDPRDVVASRLNMPWSSGSYLAVAKEWERIAQQLIDDQRELSPAIYTLLRYEDMVTNPEESMTRLCQFLGESFEAGMLKTKGADAGSFAEREKSWKGRSVQALSTSRIGVYGQSLSRRQISTIEKICALGMQKFAYEPSINTSKWHWAILDGLDLGHDILHRWKRSIAKRLGATR